MEVAPVDQGQADLGIDAQAARRVQAGEPASDDDHAVRQASDLAGGTMSQFYRGGRSAHLAARGRYLSRSAPASTACAAASRATGTRNGEHDT